MSQPDNSVDPGRHSALQRIPAITHLLQTPAARGWQGTHPVSLVTDSLRKAVAQARASVLSGERKDPPGQDELLQAAGDFLARSTSPRVRHAINATGIILHTGLGRAVLPPGVVESVIPELKGCCTLAIDVETGERAERDELVEPILTAARSVCRKSWRKAGQSLLRSAQPTART
jgi:L-seryl-tRNA(Ser) seleniumtransferase